MGLDPALHVSKTTPGWIRILRTMTSERRLAAVLFAASAGYLAAALLITEPEGQYAAIGPRAFPVAIGIGLVLCSLRIGLSAREPGGHAVADSQLDADWRLAGWSALVFLAYVALFEPVGYLPATIAFITIESRLLGSRAWIRDLAAAIVITASVYAAFNLLLGIRLPAGFLG